ncbi:phosphatidylglycerophosphatase A [Alphaproteobacteria bacterium]|nr:phosphatidylglycerophosphatase A [Alphaproteobacteria bacterium]
MNKIILILPTLFGIGYSPIAPGTIGSIFSIVFLYFLIKFVSYSFLVIIFLIIFFSSLKLINKYSNLLKSHDSSTIVIDEFLGIFLIILFYDYLKFANDFVMFLLILILFRFFDIFKIFPINWVDKNIKNSFGVILDDLLAGVYSIIVLYSINVFI